MGTYRTRFANDTVRISARTRMKIDGIISEIEVSPENKPVIERYLVCTVRCLEHVNVYRQNHLEEHTRIRGSRI